VLISGAVAAGLFLSLGSGSPSGSRSSRPSGPLASGATGSESLGEVCNKTAPRRITGQAVLRATSGRYVATVYHPTSSQVFVCLTKGRADAGAQGSNFGPRGIAKPGPDQIAGLGGGAGAAPGFPGSSPLQPLPSQYRNASNATKQRMQRVVATGVESDVVAMVGSHVSQVAFDFTRGVTVDAVVHNGWYFAWWPTLDRPTSLRITTTSGRTHTEGCLPRSRSALVSPC
jgi:hypothetical protein